jgi:diguanylate cyclase (GGDEF)-like protein
MVLSRFSVSTRFLLVLAIGFTFQAGISIVSLVDLKNSLMQDRESEVKHLLQVGYSTVELYYGQSRKGLITDAQAREAAVNALRAMRYDDSNYFCVWDLNGTGVAHGGRPELEGKTFLNSPLAEKNPVVANMVGKLVDMVKSDRKEGLVTYRIPKAGQKTPLDKISYTRLFEPWGWSISTGTYVDDIDAVLRKRAIGLLWVFIGLIALASGITYVIGRDLAQAMNRLSRRVAGVAHGELDADIPDVDRADEVGVMARALLVLRDTSREAAELRLDQLTGLPTRKLLMDRLRQIKAQSARTGCYCALMLIDLDRFKALNDTHGHDAGDMLLREVARRLSAKVRAGDTVARLGGDEFVVVLVDCGKSLEEAAVTVEAVARNLLTVLGHPYRLGNIAHTGAASVGVSLFTGEDLAEEDLLKQADLAMYKAKLAGRNGFRFFDPQMEKSVLERAALEKQLRQGIESGQFQLDYQPQIGPDGAIAGAEALVRWRHPARGLVLPNEFIALAEDTGMILPLGQWVVEAACRQLAQWACDPATARLKLAINVSARQFQQPDFVQKISATLESTGANASRLTLELTESVLVDNVEDIIEKMLALKARGVNFALDDFGTGYSSLFYLKRLPLDQLKIDRPFVRDVLVDRDDAAIARMIVALGQTLGLTVVAEGVETVEQRDFLAASGCRNYQGYLFSPPLPLDDFERLCRLWEPNSQVADATV